MIFLVILFSVTLLVFTYSWHPEDEFKQLLDRFMVGGFFAVLGFIFISFRRGLGKFLYGRQIEMMKKRTSVEKLSEQWKYGGTFMFLTGIIVIVIGLIVYLI